MRSLINSMLFLGLMLSVYFLYLSTTPEGYTGIFLFFKYSVHSQIGPVVATIFFAAALLVYNQQQLRNSHEKLHVAGLVLLGVIILVGVFFFMSYKRHNRLPWEKRNVLVVVVDTLRADHVSSYGSLVSKTPNIDSIAEDGWLFERAYSHIPITLPSHSSLFTGRRPHEVSVFNNRDDFNYKQRTLAEVFKDNGYKTMAAISLGVLKARFNINRGFDTYEDELPSNGQWFNRADIITDRGIKWLEENVQSPDDTFFMWLHYQDPHEPYNPPGMPDDLAIELNGTRLVEGNLDSAAWIEIPMTLKPGVNQLDLVNLYGDRNVEDDPYYRLYFMEMNFRGDVENGPFPEQWQGKLDDARRLEEEHLFNFALDGMQNQRFLNQFDGLRFAGLIFNEIGGFSVPDDTSRRARRYIEKTGSVKITNTTGKEMNVVFRVKGGANKSSQLVRELYAKEVEYSDQEIGRLLSYMKSQNMMENTIVVFLSDHGEELNEHGRIGHIHDLYTENIHVPLIIKDPDSSIKGERISEIARIQDIAPTILDMSGITIPEYMTGKTLIEYLQRNRSSVRIHTSETFTPEAFETKFGLVDDNTLAIYTPGAEVVRQLEYYNLAEDPEQWLNRTLSGGSTENINEYTDILKKLDEAQSSTEVEREISVEREAMLQDLGYLTSGGGNAALDHLGIPNRVMVDRITAASRHLLPLGATNIVVDRPFIGADRETGAFYVHLTLDLPEDADNETVMEVQEMIIVQILPLTEQFPLRFTISAGERVVLDRVLGGNSEKLMQFYTMRIMRILMHQPFPATISPAMELSFIPLDRNLTTITGAPRSH